MAKQPGRFFLLGCLTAAQTLLAAEVPHGLVSRSGDRSVILHWDHPTESNISSYKVYRATSSDGPFVLQTNRTPGAVSFCDVRVSNETNYFYRVTALNAQGEESQPSTNISVIPRPFASNEEFLDYVQQTGFDYFWYEANPANGLVKDRSTPDSVCSIAAVGFGLTTIGIGIDHGWISRAQGRERVLRTLNTFWSLPQGSNTTGTIGYKGWFYHFLDMKTGLQHATFRAELSSIDTALLLAGIVYAKQYFDGADADEVAIRTTADAILNRVDWNWMARGTDVLSMGWFPSSGFLPATWVGYNEASILYILGLGVEANALPETSWGRWTNGYTWATYYGQSFVPFPPLFGHQYSQCWLDLRHTADGYMKAKGITYFENSRRATLAQRSYCIENPYGRAGYGGNVWGLTACDGPLPVGYSARGAPPSQQDDGTLAPTAVGGSVPFAPEYCVQALRYIYDRFRANLWTSYGFCDAYNLGLSWWDTDVLGIDQGPIVIMIENYRTQRVWKRFMNDPVVQRGLKRAGFVSLSFVPARLNYVPANDFATLAWDAAQGRAYQVEYSPDLVSWFISPTGRVVSVASTAEWIDHGPPATDSKPSAVSQRYYRVFEYGGP